MMKKTIYSALATLALICAMWLTSYVATTPGDQIIPALLVGLCASLTVTFTLAAAKADK